MTDKNFLSIDKARGKTQQIFGKNFDEEKLAKLIVDAKAKKEKMKNG